MYKLTYPVEKYDETALDKQIILTLIKQHRNKAVPPIRKNIKYYEGKHEILSRRKADKNAPNNKTVCNHAKDISDTATGYFMSSALTFRCSDDGMNLDKLTDAFDQGDVDETDHDNALDMSRAGCAYEFVFAKEGTNILSSKNLDPRNTFIVYDDTIEENELFGVYYNYVKDDTTGKFKFVADIVTENYRYHMTLFNDGSNLYTEDPEEHHMMEMPIILYQNNKDCIGDYEQQITLMDAYNTLMSDRVNDKEQFLNALLILYGARLADDAIDSEGVTEISKALKVLKENGFLELPEGAKAEYIARTLDENGVETLRKALKEDIYTFSHVPNMADENFAGNASGVAMEYKLLALENITKTKERYYTKGLKKRIRLYCNYLGMLNISANPTAIIPTFKRGLPKNLLELSQIIANLKGFVSRKTLIQQLPFVEDPEGEIDAVDEENAEAMKQQQQMFGYTANTPPEEDEDGKDEGNGPATNRKGTKRAIGMDDPVIDG